MKSFDLSYSHEQAQPDIDALLALRAPPGASDADADARQFHILQAAESDGILIGESRALAVLSGEAPRSADEAALAGARDCFDLLCSRAGAPCFSEREVRLLHMLTESHGPGGGKYKTSNNIVPYITEEGKKSARIAPVPAAEVPEAMQRLSDAFKAALAGSPSAQLAAVPCFVADFLYISPFADGNGRLARLLALQLLDICGFGAWRFAPFRIPAPQGDTRHPFVPQFLKNLRACHEKTRRPAIAPPLGGGLTKRERIAAAALSGGEVSKHSLCEALPDVSVTLAELVLGELIRGGKLVKVGAGRATKYRPLP
ncbi:MAG: Fic family protein [Oscillospiraceae bacterium]|jgi:hypothetical protein|nr:Fic family protein [Oscillospiraceae bacterium]